MKKEKPIALVLGDIDLLHPLGLAEIECAVAAKSGDLPRYSRFAKVILDRIDPWSDPEKQISILTDFAVRQEVKPVLFYEWDSDLMLVSRFREKLGSHFDFIVPNADLVESLVDKSKFHRLAEMLDLPVPKTRILDGPESEEMDLDFPIVLKPLTRRKSEWGPVAGLKKALLIEDISQFQEIKQKLAGTNLRLMAQELVPGNESKIESYHVYVDVAGEIVCDFAGRKIRTFPSEFGQSCALEISDAEDVVAIGRSVIRKLDLRGVAKIDFKRAPDGRLFILEVNPRFNLWHNLGAAAGVNIPALVYADLTGQPRPVFSKAKKGTTWSRIWQDFFAARNEGVPFLKWFFWSVNTNAKAGFCLKDPLPVVRGGIWRVFSKISPRFFSSGKEDQNGEDLGLEQKVYLK